MKKEVEKIAGVLTEKPIHVWFGGFLFHVRPLTLSQIYEIGAIVENMQDVTFESEKVNALATSLQYYNNIPLCQQVILISMFRNRVWRKLWSRYISKRMTVTKYRRLLEYMMITFQAAFFLTSFTFLKGVKTITSPTNTGEATAHGDLSEE